MLLCALVAFVACEQAPIEEQSAIRYEAPDTITVGFEGDDTRIQLQNGKTVWTKGDHVSVFYRSNVNEEWQFMGETGDRTGQIVPVDNSVNPPATHNHVVVAYPYSADYFYNTETHNVEASLPAVQSYLKDSYGTNGNVMISSSEFNQVSLKSVCGWLKLQLKGDGEVVKSITLRGNSGEQVAGLIYVDSAAATATLASASGEAGDGEVGGTLVRPGTILTEVTLDCGEGVTLGAEATAFYIALPPQSFEKGFSVDIECEGYETMMLSTSNTLVIERNTIQPMASVEHNATPKIPNNQIWYTSSDGNVVKPYMYEFGATAKSNTYSNGKGVITFYGDVTTIGEEAFRSCTSLTSVTIPDSVTTIGGSAFYNCTRLASVTIPDSVISIGNMAFYGCSSLTSVTIGDSVTTIGGYAFYGCSSLTSVTIPDSVTTIGNFAFYWCTSLTSVTIGDSVTTIGESAFYKCSSLTSVTIGDSVTTIGGSAFYNCKSLASVTIGDSVTTIGMDAFWGCNSLTSVTIPDSVTTIGWYAFYSCSSLTSVTIGNSVATIGEQTFYNCESLTSVTIGNSVTSIGASAFSDCYSLASVTIPDSVTTIGEEAFRSCTSLTSVTIPDSVTTIGDRAFYYCENLTSVTIPDSVTTIEGYAFAGCSSLTSVTIPDSVKTIRNYAFCDCTSLTIVYCKATTPPSLSSYVFKNNASGRKIYVPTESVDAYKRATNWSSYKSSIYGYDF